MKTKKFLSIFLVMAMVLSLLPSISIPAQAAELPTDYWTDTGNYEPVTPSGGVYYVSSAAQLAWVAFECNSGNNTFENCTVFINNAIDLSAHLWKPIGTTATVFKGKVQGNGFLISGVTINSENESLGGVFGKVLNTEIRGVGVQVSINAESSSEMCIGGLAGYIENSDVYSCYVTGNISVTCSNTNGFGSVGGLLGEITGGGIYLCYSKADVSAIATSENLESSSYVGGLAGVMRDSLIYNCYATGDVTSSDFYTYAGGLFGRVNVDTAAQSIHTSYYSGTVSDAQYNGAIAGTYFGGTVDFSAYYNSNNMTADEGDSDAIDSTGMSANDMKTSTFVATLNTVVSAWTQISGVNDDYPVLIGVGEGCTPSTYSVSGTVSKGTTSATVSGLTVTLYSSGTATSYTDTTDANGNFEITGVPNGTYTAVIAAVSGNCALSESDSFTVDGANLTTGADIILKAEASGVWDRTISTILSGSGTSADPFRISSGADLAYMAQQVNADGNIADVGGNMSEAKSAYYKLTADIVLNENASNYTNWGMTAPSNSWTPIGSESNPFTGTFDGDGHTVSGVYINNAASNCQGLFGRIHGTVKNVGVRDSYIEGQYSVGGIAGYIDSGLILNCYNNSSVNGNTCVGGIYGNGSGTVQYCGNAGSVSALPGGNAGGIGGNAYGTVQYCYNIASITGNVEIGGIVGTAGGSVSDCYNSGSVNGSSMVGGAAGTIDGATGSVTNCYSSGTVNGSSNVGGVVGIDSGNKTSSCYYDKQMCVKGGINGSDMSGRAEGKLTSEMAVDTAFSGWDGGKWTFASGLYPRLTGMDTTDAAYVSASPISLSATDTAASVKSNFTASTANSVIWASDNTGVIGISSDGKASVAGSGSVTLTASINGVSRAVTLTASYTPSTYSVSGAVSAGSTGVTELSGITVNLYASTDTAYATPLYTGTTSTGGAYTITGVPNGTYIAAVAAKSGSYILSESAAFAVSGSNVTTGADIMLKAVASGVWDGTISTSLSGSGTSADPFRISSGADLAYMAQQVNADGNIADVGGNMSEASSAYYKLTADIVLNDTSNWTSWNSSTSGLHSWTPIGSATGKFKGVFDGADCTVSGIFISTAADYQGLFGYISGTVKNVGVISSYIKGGDCTAGVVGQNNGTLLYCYNTGNVNGNIGYIGGVTGGNYGTVQYCYNIGSISGIDYVGGVAGYNGYSLSDCYNAGSVTGSSTYTGTGGIGGVAGTNDSSLSNCYNAGSVTGSTTNTSVDIGGVAGTNADTVMACYYDKQMCAAGGIAGADSSGSAEGKLTSEMAVDTAFSGWDGGKWTFASGLYPRLTGMDTTDAAYVSASPISLSATDTAASVKSNFTASTANSVIWASDNTGVIGISSDGKASVAGSGSVTLTASINGVSRAVTLTASYTPSTYSVSGTVSAGSTGVTELSGITVNLYASTDTAYATPLYTGTTGTGGAYTITGVPNGTYIAAVAAKSGSYILSESAAFAVSGSNVTTGADIMLKAVASGLADYVITGGPTSFQVNGSGSYETLAAALAVCTNSGDDGKLVIMFGNGSPALTVKEKLTADTTPQALISATYIGSIQINRDSSIPNNSQTYGVCIPAGVNADFSNLSVEDSGTSDRAELAAIYVSGGSLTVNSGTSITVNGSGNCSILAVSGSVIIENGILTAKDVNSTNYALVCKGNASATINGGKLEACGKNGTAIVQNSTGTVTVTGGEIVASCTGDYTNAGIGIAANAGKVTVSGGKISSAGSKMMAGGISLTNATNSLVEISGSAEITGVISAVSNISMGSSKSGTVNILGGTLTATGFSSMTILNVMGTVNISGGKIISQGTETFASAVFSFSGVSVFSAEMNVSGTAELSSAVPSTIILYNQDTSGASDPDSMSACVFGKTIYGSNKASIGISGTGSGPYTINSANYTAAKVSAESMVDGNTFVGWTSDSARSNVISTTSPATISSLTTGANSAVTSIYLKTDAVVTPDYTITGGPTSFSVSGDANTYTTLADALAVCTDDGDDDKLTIQLGNGTISLKVNELLQTGTANLLKNGLKAATYSGSVEIQDTSVDYGYGLVVPNTGVIFDGLTVTQNIIATMVPSYAVYVMKAGNLSVKGATSINASYDRERGILNRGTFTMSGGQVSATAIGGYGLVNEGTATISGGTFMGSGKDSCCINNLDTDSGTGTLTVNGGTFHVEGENSKIIDNAGKMSVTGGSFTAGNGTAQQSMCILSSALPSANATISGGSLISNDPSGFGVFNIGTLTISGSAEIISAAINTIYMSMKMNANTTLFGKTIHGSTEAFISMKGADSSSGRKISSSNYANAALIVPGILGGKSFSAWTSDSAFANSISSINGDTVSNLTTGANASVTDIYLKTGTDTAILLASGSLGTAGNSSITGLKSGTKYKVTMGSVVYYVKADGTLSANASDAAALTGTEIWLLINGSTYNVEEYSLPAVVLALGSLGIAGNSKITGLTSGTVYKITVGSTVYYVKADGTLSTNASDAAALTGTEITGLTNGTAYKVEVYTTGGGGSGGSGSYTPTTDTGAKIEVGGKAQTAGTAETTTQNGNTITTVTISTDKLKNILASASNGVTVTIPITTGSDTASGKLDGQAVKDMEKKNATLVINTGSASYILPASDINIDSVAGQFDKNVSLSDIAVNVSISKPSDATAKVVANSAASGGFSIQVPAVEFTVSCTYGGKTVEVSTFNSYVERMIAIPDGVDASKITTAIVVEADGSVHHVPTEVTVVGGKYYAKINSLTNSVYTLIYNPIKFSDVENHWAKDSINDMGSRLVVSGTGGNNYEPSRNITRAEMAAIMVRALGLEPGTGTNGFSDVDSSAWYCKYIETASTYGIIKGYDSSTFGPNDTITREQAMAMIARAMKITGLEVSLSDSDIIGLLTGYTDATSSSDYAKISVASCLKTGIVSGTSKNTISPKDYVTRAEAAVMVERLLQKSELI